MQITKIGTVVLLAIVGLALYLNPILAQEEPSPEEPPSQESEEPMIPQVPEVKVSQEIIGGGGPAGGILFLDLDVLNQKLKDNEYKPLNDMLFVTGGGGFGGGLKNMRFGGMGFGGEAKTHQGQKTAKLSLGFGGFLMERGLYADKQFSLTAGAVIGGGGADLTLLDHRSDTFDEAISEPPNVFLTRGFWGVQPYAGIEFALLDWIMLKVNVGYLWAFGGPWKQDEVTVSGPPESLNSYLVEFMIAFGGRTAPEEEVKPETQK